MKTEETVMIVIIVVLLVFLLGGFGWGMMGYGMMSGFYTGFGLFGWLYHTVILIALILLIIWLVKQLQNSGGKRR